MAKIYFQLCCGGFFLASVLLACSLQGQERQEGLSGNGSSFFERAAPGRAAPGRATPMCGPECACGCRTGQACHCAENGGCPQKEQLFLDRGNSACSSDCSCGCGDGFPCHCAENGGCEEVEECQDRDLPVGHIFNVFPPYEDTCPGTCGIWLPEDPVLFRPLMADPRQVTYSVGWRFNDQALETNVIDVSFGDSIAFYRWLDIGPCNGQLQVDLEGGLWAVFDPLHDSSPLINADYYVGVPITYAFDDWSFRLRGYHISCHIGDEFLLNHPTFERRNPSAEFVDLYGSWDYTDELRFYAGLGVVVAQDESWRRGRVYYEAGVEVRMPRLGFVDRCSQVYGMPIFAMDFFHQNGQTRHLNQTYVLGYEWGKLSGTQRKLRLYMEYHDGYSYEGQFCTHPTNYFSVRIGYGY